jgi:hypothetical protein
VTGQSIRANSSKQYGSAAKESRPHEYEKPKARSDNATVPDQLVDDSADGVRWDGEPNTSAGARRAVDHCVDPDQTALRIKERAA